MVCTLIHSFIHCSYVPNFPSAHTYMIALAVANIAVIHFCFLNFPQIFVTQFLF